MKALVLTVLLLGLLMAGFGVYFIALGNEARGWPEVEGQILATTVKLDLTRPVDGVGYLTDSQREQASRYYPSISYAWSVDGERHTGSRFQLGTTFEKFRTRREAVAAAAEYPPGEPIPVYYDPKDPSQAVLDRSLSGGVYVPLPLGLLFTLTGWLGLRYFDVLRQAMTTQASGVETGANTP